MKTSFKHLFVLAVGVIPICDNANAFQDRLELIERFRTEAPVAWQKHQEILRTSDYSSSESEKRIPARGQRFEKLEYRKFSRVDSRFRLMVHKPADRELYSVKGQNPQYRFLIQGKSGDGPWVLQELQRMNKPMENDYQTQTKSENETAKSAWARFPCGTTGTYWFDLDDLKILDARIIEYRGAECIQLEMEFMEISVLFGRQAYEGEALDHSKIVEKDIHHHCKAIFDPELYWLVREVDGYHEGGVHPEKQLYKQVREYDSGIRGVPQITVDESYRWNHWKQDLLLFEKTVWKYFVRNPVPSDFTVSAFGLAEPDWYIPPQPWWLYASLTGMGLLLVGAVLLRYGKKVWKRN